MKNTQIGMPGYLDTSTETQNGLNHGPEWKTQSFLLKGICTVILWQDCCGKGHLRKFCWNTVGKKFRIGNISSLTDKKYYSYQCFVDDLKLAGKKQNLNTMWKIPMKDVDLGQPTSFFDHVYLGST